MFIINMNDRKTLLDLIVFQLSQLDNDYIKEFPTTTLIEAIEKKSNLLPTLISIILNSGVKRHNNFCGKYCRHLEHILRALFDHMARLSILSVNWESFVLITYSIRVNLRSSQLACNLRNHAARIICDSNWIMKSTKHYGTEQGIGRLNIEQIIELDKLCLKTNHYRHKNNAFVTKMETILPVFPKELIEIITSYMCLDDMFVKK